MNKIKPIFFILILSMLLLAQCDVPDSPDVTPPVVVVLYPYAGSVLSDTVLVSIDATDERGVKRIWYYLDGIKMGEVESAHANFELDVTEIVDNQIHVIYGAAADESGNVGYSEQISVILSESEDNISPVVQLIYPLPGQILTGIVEVRVEASDDRELEKIEFFTDGDLKSTVAAEKSDSIYTFIWNTTSYELNSTHTLYFKAIDKAGNQSINDPVNFVIGLVDVTPPTVVLLYPLEGEILSGTVNVSVDANDDVRVTKVEFYVDGVLTYTDQNTPWRFSWNTTPWADGGNHTLYIKAYDATGNIGTSGPAAFIIN